MSFEIMGIGAMLFGAARIDGGHRRQGWFCVLCGLAILILRHAF